MNTIIKQKTTTITKLKQQKLQALYVCFTKQKNQLIYDNNVQSLYNTKQS